MTLQIKKASKAESKLRMALMGPAGSGKTFTSLSIASEMGNVLVVDTERGSASKYAGIFPDFDVIELEEFSPDNFIQAIRLAEKHQYSVVILDSLSHAWMGKGGVLELHDQATKKTPNSFAAWRDVTPKHNELVDAILQSKLHIIATMRSKTEYVQDRDDKGRTQIKRVGMAPVQRDGLEYEFDVIADLDLENNFIVGKTRCPALSGKVFNRAGVNVAVILTDWLKGEKEKPTSIKPLEIVKPAPATSFPETSGFPETTEPATPQTSIAQEVAQDDRFFTTTAQLDQKVAQIDEAIDLTNKLVVKIRGVLRELNKDEAAFNKWFQAQYNSTMNWCDMSVKVLREMETQVERWLSNEKAKARTGLKEELMKRDDFVTDVENLLKQMGKKESDFVSWYQGYFTMEVSDWRKASTEARAETVRVLSNMVQSTQQRQAA